MSSKPRKRVRGEEQCHKSTFLSHDVDSGVGGGEQWTLEPEDNLTLKDTVFKNICNIYLFAIKLIDD